MRATFPLVPNLPGHRYADSRRSNFGMVTFKVVGLFVVEFCGFLGQIVDRGLIAVVSVIGGVVVMSVYDGLAWFAHFQIAWLPKDLPGHNGRAFGIEYLAACTTMMFASKSCESITAIEAVFCILVTHPELAV
jgi:hypothetical protein